MIRKYAEIFCWKNVSSFCSAKATHIFQAKNIRILYTESAKTVNEMILNELVKLTTLWTTGPRGAKFLPIPALHDTASMQTSHFFFFNQKRLIIFLFQFEYIGYAYSLEASHWGASYEYPQLMFCAEIRKTMIQVESYDFPVYIYKLYWHFIRVHSLYIFGVWILAHQSQIQVRQCSIIGVCVISIFK